MMQRYFIRLSFDGSPFHGWQQQPNASSVQQELEKALSLIYRQAIAVTGAGRTDTGVHAHNYIAHCDLPQLLNIEALKAFIYKVNGLLPKEIVVHSLIAMHPEAHARFDAISRSYFYQISQQKNPFLLNSSWQRYGNLDIDQMNEGCKILLQTHDFSSFAKLHSDNKTNLCKLTQAHWSYDEALEVLRFDISADRFLRNMVRSIVGTLVDLGRGKIDLEHFQQIVADKNRNSAGLSAPAQGLFFCNARYPYIVNDSYLLLE
jgi:tRNA pseudouridine38-40 synthase